MNENGTYIVPANSKKSQLILSYFTLFDLIVFVIGVSISIILLMIFKSDNFLVMIGLALPALISAFLILPLPPYYHNIMTFIGNFNKYMVSIKKYYWRGWCQSYGDRERK